jgi:hypothetical protein
MVRIPSYILEPSGDVGAIYGGRGHTFCWYKFSGIVRLMATYV